MILITKNVKNLNQVFCMKCVKKSEDGKPMLQSEKLKQAGNTQPMLEISLQIT